MALTDKKYSSVHSKTGSDKDKLKANYDDGHINTFADLADNGTNPEFGALIYQIQEMQEELDYLRTEISNNKDKATFPGFGTTNSTALVGNTALLQLGTTNKTALAGNTTTITGTQTTVIAANEKAVASNTSSITGLNSDMKAVQRNLTVSTETGITAKFANLKVGLKSTTIDLEITDNSGKLPVTRKATITIQ